MEKDKRNDEISMWGRCNVGFESYHVGSLESSQYKYHLKNLSK